MIFHDVTILYELKVRANSRTKSFKVILMAITERYIVK